MKAQGCLFEPIPSSVSLSSSGAAGTRETEQKRLNANALRLLAFFQARPRRWIRNHDLVAPGGLRYGGRIFELRGDGWLIDDKHYKGGVWLYRFRGMKSAS